MIEEISKCNSQIAMNKQVVGKHMEDYKSTFTNNQFFMDKSSQQLKGVQVNLESLKAYLDSKIE